MEKILVRFDMQDCKARVTPFEQKVNCTDGVEMMDDVRKYRGSGLPDLFAFV